MDDIKKNKISTILKILKERENYAFFFEKYLRIRDRETSEIIPFIANDSQKKLLDIIEKWEKEKDKKTLYIIILKARRQGFSTCTEGVFFKRLLHETHKTAMVVSYDDDSASNINDMSDVFYQYLPDEIKPERRAARGKGILFENPKYEPSQPVSANNQPGLQCRFLIDTARNMNAGSGFNIHYLHLSELSKYPGDIHMMLTSLLQAVPSQNSIVIVESTGFGYNYFKELWDSAVAKRNDFIPLFIPWFEDKGCTLAYTRFKLTEEEKILKKTYGVTNDQLEWRRWCIKNKCGGDSRMFRQEYPSCPEESFLFSGSPVFDNDKVMIRISDLRKHYKDNPYLVGDFSYTMKDGVIDDKSIKFIECPDGQFSIYHKPKQGYPYTLSVDTAEGGADYSAGQVLDNTNGMQVAVWHGHTDTDIMAKLSYCIGKYYNDALIGPEVNFDSHVVKELQRLGYWNLYKREVVDSISMQSQEKYGFRTDSLTRPLIIDDLKTIVRENIGLLSDIPTLEEMLTFVKNSQNRPEALSGKHDDLVMSLAIGYFIRRQMWTDVTEEVVKDEDYSDYYEGRYKDVSKNTSNWLT